MIIFRRANFRAIFFFSIAIVLSILTTFTHQVNSLEPTQRKTTHSNLRGGPSNREHLIGHSTADGKLNVDNLEAVVSHVINRAIILIRKLVRIKIPGLVDTVNYADNISVIVNNMKIKFHSKITYPDHKSLINARTVILITFGVLLSVKRLKTNGNPESLNHFEVIARVDSKLFTFVGKLFKDMGAIVDNVAYTSSKGFYIRSNDYLISNRDDMESGGKKRETNIFIDFIMDQPRLLYFIVRDGYDIQNNQVSISDDSRKNSINTFHVSDCSSMQIDKIKYSEPFSRLNITVENDQQFKCLVLDSNKINLQQMRIILKLVTSLSSDINSLGLSNNLKQGVRRVPHSGDKSRLFDHFDISHLIETGHSSHTSDPYKILLEEIIRVDRRLDGSDSVKMIGRIDHITLMDYVLFHIFCGAVLIFGLLWCFFKVKI